MTPACIDAPLNLLPGARKNPRWHAIHIADPNPNYAAVLLPRSGLSQMVIPPMVGAEFNLVESFEESGRGGRGGGFGSTGVW